MSTPNARSIGILQTDCFASSDLGRSSLHPGRGEQIKTPQLAHVKLEPKAGLRSPYIIIRTPYPSCSRWSTGNLRDLLSCRKGCAIGVEGYCGSCSTRAQKALNLRKTLLSSRSAVRHGHYTYIFGRKMLCGRRTIEAIITPHRAGKRSRSVVQCRLMLHWRP